jgi:TetR/AcrR family transcriptional regulator, cholesterol catabolism regulator
MTRTITSGDDSGSDSLKVQPRSTAERLLQGAAKLFSHKGYAATSTRELAALAGIQNASLYHYVDGKEDLLYQLCLTTLDSVADVFQAAISADGSALDRLEKLARDYAELVLTDRERHTTMLIELRSLSMDRREAVVSHRDQNVALVRQLVGDAQKAGDIRDDIQSKYLTLALFNLLNWSIFWYQPGGDLTPRDIADMLWSIFAHGITVKSAGDRARREGESL